MSKVIISENYLTDIANSIRNKNGASTTKYTPKEMSPAIDALSMKDDSQLIELLDGSLTTLTVPDSVTSIRSNAFTNMSSLTTININQDYNGISGQTWGATNATVNWLKGTKYPITITQSPNETITVTVDGKNYTESFEYYKGATLTATAKGASGYKAGAVSPASTTISGPVTFTVADATVSVSYRKFTFNKNDNMGPWDLKLDNSTERELNGYDSSNPLFQPYSNGIYLNIKYSDTITSSDFSSGGTLYTFMYSHNMQLTRESDGYGLLWSSPYVGRARSVYGIFCWSYVHSCSPASGISDTNTGTIWNNLKTSYNNGENLVIEFIDK